MIAKEKEMEKVPEAEAEAEAAAKAAAKAAAETQKVKDSGRDKAPAPVKARLYTRSLGALLGGRADLRRRISDIYALKVPGNFDHFLEKKIDLPRMSCSKRCWLRIHTETLLSVRTSNKFDTLVDKIHHTKNRHSVTTSFFP